MSGDREGAEHPSGDVVGGRRKGTECVKGPVVLESLPMPEASTGEVGYCKPPEHTRWRKGCKSPNPKGRPSKQPAGPYTAALEKKITYQAGGRREKVTRREALDRKLRQDAATGSHAARKLWEERKRADQARLVEASRRPPKINPQPPPEIRMATRMDAFHRFIDKHLPGFFDALSTLHRLGLVAGLALVEPDEVQAQDV